jgi:hypothetical protein
MSARWVEHSFTPHMLDFCAVYQDLFASIGWPGRYIRAGLRPANWPPSIGTVAPVMKDA